MIKVGEHITLDIIGTKKEYEASFFEGLVHKIAEKAKVTVLNIAKYTFEPQGFTLVALLAESHISFHTYPEKGIISFDFYTCGTVAPSIALDVIKKDTCPEYISKSHKWTKQFLPTKFFGNSYDKLDSEFEKIPDIESNKENYAIESYELNPGDAIAFNFATVHGAPENNSDNKRRAFSARYTGDDATYIKRKGEMSPPFPELKLKNGDNLDCETFPVVLN